MPNTDQRRSGVLPLGQGRVSLSLRHRAWLVLLLLLVGPPRSARAESWTAIARDQLYCLSLATSAERASLSVTLPGDTAAQGKEYWDSTAATPADRVQRYLMLLASLGFMADRIDDQNLRTDLLGQILFQTKQARESGPIAMRQAFRCAYATMLSSAVELDDPVRIDEVVRNLILEYRDPAVGPAVWDLPLVYALRELSLAPPGDSLRMLADEAVAQGQRVQAGDPFRARRLLAAAGDALIALGDPRRGNAFAMEANALVSGKASSIENKWLTFPALYDATRSVYGQGSGTKLARAMQELLPLPAQLADSKLEYEICIRLFEANSSDAVSEEDYQRANAWRLRADSAVLNMTASIPMMRAAFARDPNLQGANAQAIIWNRDKVAARRVYESTYQPMLASLKRQALDLPLSDTRSLLHFEWKVAIWLGTMSPLAEALPEKRAEITSMVFEGMQLQSSGQVSAAAVAPHLNKLPNDVRQNVDRFIRMQTSLSAFLRTVMGREYLPDPMTSADARKLSTAFAVLDITYSESTQALGQFRAYVRTTAPALAPLLNPVPVRLNEIESILHQDEALVSIVTTGDHLFVLAANSTAASFRVSPATPLRIDTLVRQLRASLLPSESGGRISVEPFNAGAAFELYAATLGLVSEVTGNKTHIFWYANGPLAAIPPGVMIQRKPRKAWVTASAELRQLAWVADTQATSVLPELSLFLPYRLAVLTGNPERTFIGIGAPGLSASELEGARAARSGALAGGLKGRALADLPKLPETATELRRLATVLGEDGSLLLLGGDANKNKIRETLRSTSAGVIAFATHGFVAGEIAEMPEPSLLLDMKPGMDDAEGLLSASEIEGLRLTSRLAILSACSTATSDGRPRGESFTGLAKSFTQAGARALLVSHWPVASGAAANLSVRTVELSKKEHLPLAIALARAMRELRNAPDDGEISTAHPFYWAPFVFVGDGARVLP